MDIKGLDKATLLCALYNCAKKPDGASANLSLEEATTIILDNPNVRKIYQRSLFVDLSGDTFDDALYDSFNGVDAAYRAIDNVRWQAAARARNKIQAIKIFKDKYGVSLLEAKCAVEAELAPKVEWGQLLVLPDGRKVRFFSCERGICLEEIR